jgi:hypothetical protein
MKFVLYCIECGEDGPTMSITSLAAAIGDPVKWEKFLRTHVDHGDAQFGLRTRK